MIFDNAGYFFVTYPNSNDTIFYYLNRDDGDSVSISTILDIENQSSDTPLTLQAFKQMDKFSTLEMNDIQVIAPLITANSASTY